jgi:Bifunctional DNA primase/polymerase, N-terminal
MSAISNIAKFARRYCEIGLALTFTSPGAKGPRHAGWNIPENTIRDPKRAFGYWHLNPSHGVAALLGPSGLVSLDVDDERQSPGVLKHFGIDLEALRETTPTIVGRHFRLMFRAPAAELKHRSATWPNQGAPGNFVLFELRAGNLADTLPPTRHAVTGLPYRWENPPKHGFPQLPDRLLDIWQDWEATKLAIHALCPWAPPPPPPSEPRPHREYNGPSVIEAFNAAHDVTALLESHGYQKRGKRFIAPDSGHAPGVSLLDNGKIYCHHQGDVLASERALDAFDVFRLLDHGGDFRAAVKAAAQALGLDRERAA